MHCKSSMWHRVTDIGKDIPESTRFEEGSNGREPCRAQPRILPPGESFNSCLNASVLFQGFVFSIRNEATSGSASWT